MASIFKNNILIINAHPYHESFCSEISKKYFHGTTQSKANVKLINLTELDIDWTFSNGYNKNTNEAGIINIQNLISNASHSYTHLYSEIVFL